jgi:hypothetical protein
MTTLDLHHLLAVLSVLLAAIALPPAASTVLLAFVLGLIAGHNIRNPTG